MQVLEGKFQERSYLKSGLSPLVLASVVCVTSALNYPFIKVRSFLAVRCKCDIFDLVSAVD